MEYEYYYEDDYADEPAPTVPAPKGSGGSRTKTKDANYDIEDLVKAWREYLKDKKNGIKLKYPSF